MTTSVFVLLCLIVITYIFIQYKINSYAKKKLKESEQIDTTVASYDPIVKSGDYKLVITSVGPQIETANKIITRYHGMEIKDNQMPFTVLTDVWVYTAEDCLAELEEIGVSAYVWK